MGFISSLLFLCSVGFCFKCNNVSGTNINVNQRKKSLHSGFGDFKKGYPKYCYVICNISEFYDMYTYDCINNYFDSDDNDYLSNELTDTVAIPEVNRENQNSDKINHFDKNTVASRRQITKFTKQKYDKNSDEEKDWYKEQNRRKAQDLLRYFTTIRRNVNVDSNDDSNSNQVQSERGFNNQEPANYQNKKSKKLKSIMNYKKDQYNARLKKRMQDTPMDTIDDHHYHKPR